MRQTNLRSLATILTLAIGLTTGCATPRLYQPVQPGLLLFSQDGSLVDRESVADMLEDSDQARPVIAENGFYTLDGIYKTTGIVGLGAIATAMILRVAKADPTATVITGGAGAGLDLVSLAFLIASNVMLGDGVRAHNASLAGTPSGGSGAAGEF